MVLGSDLYLMESHVCAWWSGTGILAHCHLQASAGSLVSEYSNILLILLLHCHLKLALTVLEVDIGTLPIYLNPYQYT